MCITLHVVRFSEDRHINAVNIGYIPILKALIPFQTGTGQNPPPAKTPLRQKKPSGQNPPDAKIPLWPKPPSDKKPPPAKKKHPPPLQ